MKKLFSFKLEHIFALWAMTNFYQMECNGLLTRKKWRIVQIICNIWISNWQILFHICEVLENWRKESLAVSSLDKSINHYCVANCFSFFTFNTIVSTIVNPSSINNYLLRTKTRKYVYLSDLWSHLIKEKHMSPFKVVRLYSVIVKRRLKKWRRL